MKKLLAIVISMAMIVAMMPMGVFADGTTSPTIEDGVIKVNPENVQDTLDGKYGSIDNKTILLSTGTYDQLELGRATKYADSNTEYRIGSFEGEPMTFNSFYNTKNDGKYSGVPYYIRNMRNVTFKAAQDAEVNIEGVLAASGHHHQNDYDYVLDRNVNGNSYFLAFKFENITFEGINFINKSDINTSLEETIIDGFTFKDCTFNINNTDNGNQAIRYYNENNNGKVKNLTVDNCEFKNCYQGVYTSHINGIKVINSAFVNTAHNAIAIQDFKENANHGVVVITNNTFNNIKDRIIRFNNVGADTQITIKNNKATDSGDSAGEVIKATSLADGITYDICGNDWGDGKVVANEQLKDAVAAIGPDKFTSLEDAIAAANDGDIVKLIKDVECDSIISIKKSIVLDGNGHSIKTTANRGIWIEANNLNISLNNFKLIAGTGTERGVQINQNVKGINLKINSCEINATYYGINVCSGASVELAITNSKVSAWGALNLWSEEYSVTAENSAFIGNNDKAYNKDGWNRFGTIVLEGDTTGKTEDHAELNTVTLNNCNVVSESKNGNSQCAFLFNSQSKDNKVYVNGSNTMVNVPETEVLCEDNGSGNELLISAGTFSKDPSKYVVSGYYADKSGEAWTVKPVPYTPSTPADNVTNNPADKNTTADLAPAVKDNKAETTVDAKTADKIVDKAVANKSTEVIVDAAGNNTVASSEVGIPEKTVKELAEKTDANLVIKTDNGKVDLDKTALAAVAEQAGTTGTVRLVVETVKTDENICHVELKLITSNGAVKDFRGGNVKVTINLTKELAAKDVVCVYINDNGIYTLVEGVLNADGTYTFTTGHFSEYAVMAKDEADKVIAEQLNTLIKEVNLKVRTSKTSKKNIKAVVSGDVTALTDAGYTVKYKFYRSAKKAAEYKAVKTKDTNTYINTAGKKGTKYYYPAKVMVYSGDTLAGQTVLKQCKYGARTWSK